MGMVWTMLKCAFIVQAALYRESIRRRDGRGKEGANSKVRASSTSGPRPGSIGPPVTWRGEWPRE